MELFNWAYKILKNIGLGHVSAIYINLVINLIVIGLIAYVIDKIAKRVLILGFIILARSTKTSFDDFLVKNRTSKFVAHLIPLYFIYKAAPVALKDFTYWEYIFSKGITTFIILISIWIMRSIFSAVGDYLKLQPDYNDKPIDSYVQVLMLVLWVFGITSIILLLFEVDFLKLLGTFGAISAIFIVVSVINETLLRS